MTVLLIDTCGAIGSVAVADSATGEVLARATLPGRSASERLISTIREMMAGQPQGIAGVDCVAVVHGPGSFTGVRVGLSAAKGLCEALAVPIIAISRTQVMASVVHSSSAPVQRVDAVLSAGRGEFYFGRDWVGEGFQEALLTRAELLAMLQKGSEGVLVACEPEVVDSLAPLAVLVREPLAEDALALAIRRIDAQEFGNVATIDANYLRRTDAEIFAQRRSPAGIAE